MPAIYTWNLTQGNATSYVALGSSGVLTASPVSSYQLLTQALLLFPFSWCEVDTPGAVPTVRTNIFTSATYVLGEIGDSLLVFNAPQTVPPVRQQMRIKSASDSMLDQVSMDFYGNGLPRLPGESDANFLVRILAGLFVPRATRAAMSAMLLALTGVEPRIIETFRGSDVGGWSATTSAAPTLAGGLYYYVLAAGCPPCYWGIDIPFQPSYSALPLAPFRYTNPGVSPDKSDGLGFNAFIDTTWPLTSGAQGNGAKGWASAVPVTYPPSQSTNPGSPVVGGALDFYAVVGLATPTMVGGGYVNTLGPPRQVAGRWTYAAGGDTTTGYLGEQALDAGRLQVMTAIDSFRPYGVTTWVSVGTITRLVSPKEAYIVPNDSLTVEHFNATDLATGSVQVGSVFAVTGSAPATQNQIPRPSTGPFGSTSYYSAASRPLALSGPFTGVLIYSPTSLDISTNTVVIASGYLQGSSSKAGWCYLAGLGLAVSNGLLLSHVGSGADVANAVNIAVFGYNNISGYIYCCLNGGTVSSVSTTRYGPNTVWSDTVGVFADGTSAFGGQIYEFMLRSTQATPILLLQLYATVLAGI
jgi:hypothetical protein